jgi:hypothetical protein
VTEPDTDPSSSRRPSGGGLRLRIAATGAILTLATLSAARLASASFDEAAIPIGDVASLDGVVSGTVHLTGDRLLIYSGDSFQSNDSNLAVNFSSGGSLVLCPHSHLQILEAGQTAGVMLAFQEGGAEQPFPVHTNDVIMTPDWRIQMAGNVPAGESGTLQLSTNRRGELCLSSKAKAGQFFRVSELAGDSVYDITGQSSIRIAGGHIDNAPGGCSCLDSGGGSQAVTHEAHPTHEASLAAPAASSTPSTSQVSAVPTAKPSTSAVTPPQIAEAGSPEVINPKQRQRPQDVVGYMRSFLHVLFGR